MDINYYKKYEPIDGKWYITKELGGGTFGTVFEIERRDFTNNKSALKIITIPSSSNEVRSYREENYNLDEKSISSYFYGLVENFTDEFKLMAKLRGNSNIVSIEDYDIIEHKDEIGWDIFIRMELLTPMNKYFRDNELSRKDIVKLGIDICKALEICQKFKIIHRDIKPSNIFVSDTGEFKLGDFGIARTLEKTSSGLSKKGTYTYMAPEVFKGEEYGANVDIYSLGIVMYKLLNNNFEPFRTQRTPNDEEKALIQRLKGEKIPKPANADERLAEIVLKACNFDPGERYESPLQMREDLKKIIYSDSEANIIYPNDDEAEHKTSAGEKTVGLFDDITEKEEENNKTVSVFDFDKAAQPELENENKSAENLNLHSDHPAVDYDASDKASVVKKKRTWGIICMSAILLVNLIYGGITQNIMSVPRVISHSIYIFQIPTAIISLFVFVIISLNLILLIICRNKETVNNKIELFIKISPYICLILIILSFIVYGVNYSNACAANTGLFGKFTWGKVFNTLYMNYIYISILLIYIVGTKFMEKIKNKHMC